MLKDQEINQNLRTTRLKNGSLWSTSPGIKNGGVGYRLDFGEIGK